MTASVFRVETDKQAGSPCLRRSWRAAFSFIEIVVALAILSITMSVLFHAHAGLVRARDRVRRTEEMRLLAGRIAARYWLGDSPAVAAAREKSDWKIECRQAGATDGASNAAWECWTISPSNDANDRIELYLRRRDTPPPAKTSP